MRKINVHFNIEQLPSVLAALESAKTALENSHPDNATPDTVSAHNAVLDQVEDAIELVSEEVKRSAIRQTIRDHL